VIFINIFSFLILLAVLGFFVWLTTRAWRIKPLGLKIPAFLLSGALTLVLLLLTFVGGKGLVVAYVPPAPVPELVIEGTPEQIARGEYITKIACVGCHGADGSEAFPLSGGTKFTEELPPFAGSIVSANITPGGVLADRTDGELFNAIRFGFGKKERLGFMSFVAFRELSDEDTKAIIAYLRAQEPVKTVSNGGDQVNLLGAMLFFGSGLAPIQENQFGVIKAPAQGETAEYGKYIATIGDCRGCHGPNMTGTEASALGPGYPNPRPFVSKISQEQFIQTMRTGIRPNGIELQMPWKNASMMSDADLVALYTFLKSEP
jgi:mono/diheme cytochrome c family protein